MATLSGKEFFGSKPGQAVTQQKQKEQPKPSLFSLAGNYAADKVTSAPQTIVDTAKGGVERIKQGLEESRSGTSLASPVEAGLKVGGGAIQAITAPLAPLFSPLGDAIGWVADKIGSNKKVQEFADSDAGHMTSRIAEDVGDLSAIAGLGAGAASIKAGFNTTNPALERHITSAQQVLKNLGPDDIKTLGGEQALISRLKTNVVDGLKASGQVVDDIEALNPATFSTVDDFANALRGTVKSPVGQVAADAGAVLTRTGTAVADQAAALGGIIERGASGIKAATAKSLDPASIMQRVARIPKSRQAAFEQRAGQSVGDYLVKKGIFGDIDEITTQLFDNFQRSRTVADDSLSKLPGTFKSKPVETAITELFNREKNVSSPGALSKDFGRVRELQQKYNKEGLTMSEINEVKRLYERNVKVDYLKDRKTTEVARATNLDTALREWQFAQAEKLGLKNLPDINRDTALAKQLLDDLGKEYSGNAGNNAVTLTDWIILSGLDPTAISSFIAKKTLSSKGVQSKIAETLAGEATDPGTFPITQGGPPTIGSYADWINSIDPQ